MPTIELHFDNPDRESLYREALSRLRIDDRSEGLVTDDPTRAAKAECPCLLDRPEVVELARLEGFMCAANPIMPAHQMRFLPEILPIFQTVDSGKIGAPGLLRSHHWVTENQPAEPLAVAHIDIANRVFGSPAEIVHKTERPDYLQLHLGFGGDGMALLDIATNRPGDDAYFSMHLVGGEGTVYADDHRNTQLLLGAGGAAAIVHHQNEVLAIRNMLAEFVSGEPNWRVTLADTISARQTLGEVSHV